MLKLSLHYHLIPAGLGSVATGDAGPNRFSPSLHSMGIAWGNVFRCISLMLNMLSFNKSPNGEKT